MEISSDPKLAVGELEKVINEDHFLQLLKLEKFNVILQLKDIDWLAHWFDLWRASDSTIVISHQITIVDGINNYKFHYTGSVLEFDDSGPANLQNFYIEQLPKVTYNFKVCSSNLSAVDLILKYPSIQRLHLKSRDFVTSINLVKLLVDHQHLAAIDINFNEYVDFFLSTAASLSQDFDEAHKAGIICNKPIILQLPVPLDILSTAIKVFPQLLSIVVHFDPNISECWKISKMYPRTAIQYYECDKYIYVR